MACIYTFWGVLAWHSKMDATIAGFLGVALGYVLGRKTG
jgi:hypothetical protein